MDLHIPSWVVFTVFYDVGGAIPLALLLGAAAGVALAKGLKRENPRMLRRIGDIFRDVDGERDVL